ncbi:DUF1963 domain-containing protein [Aliihoeflea aestuarii]|uniref:DUF1963 domain-containing protein n=1 Tax=Aliihoeflea aestuarii TaxID=453840 RepID=UPI00209453B2|nr:DUF1963 domain-containing protein [Aliihoeflea aestuarii]MCO6392678.1 DUF1963 domain-containing protein [Aliihoeflea aestuarii]
MQADIPAARRDVENGIRSAFAGVVLGDGTSIGHAEYIDCWRKNPDGSPITDEQYRAMTANDIVDDWTQVTLQELERDNIAHFDLASLSRLAGFDPALPDEGRLYLFYDLLCLPASYDPASRPAFRVIHDTSPEDALVRADLPKQLAKIADARGAMLKPATLAMREAITSMLMESLATSEARMHGRHKEKYDTWLMDEVGWPGEPERDRHQVGGWPRAIQQGMQSTAQLAANGIDAGLSKAYRGKKAKALLADAGAWRLIFQLGPMRRSATCCPAP